MVGGDRVKAAFTAGVGDWKVDLKLTTVLKIRFSFETSSVSKKKLVIYETFLCN